MSEAAATPTSSALGVAAPEVPAAEAPALAPTQSERLYPTPAETATPPSEASGEPTAEAPAEAPAATEAPTEEKPAEAPAPAIDIKLPEGYEAKPEQLSSFKTLAAEAGLTSETAQKFADLYFQEAQAAQAASTAAWDKTISDWTKELNALPDFASEAKRNEAQVTIGRALDEYGSLEARQAFDLTGAGWNPHIVSTFYKMAKALSEGAPTAPGRPAAQPKTAAQRLYPE